MNDQELEYQIDQWRRAGFAVRLESFTGEGIPGVALLPNPRWICRIYQGLVPHSWESRGVYAEGFDRGEVIVHALRKAAQKWHGVV